ARGRPRGEDVVADPHLVRVAKSGHRQVVDVVDLQHGQVRLRVTPDQVGGHVLAVVEHHRGLELAGVVGRLGDHVVVGDDVAAAVYDHAGSLHAFLVALRLDGDHGIGGG